MSRKKSSYNNSKFLTVAQPPSASSATSPDDLLSIKEAARLLNVSPKTVQRLCKDGKLSYIPITPTLFRIRRSAISYFLAKQEVRVGKAA